MAAIGKPKVAQAKEKTKGRTHLAGLLATIAGSGGAGPSLSVRRLDPETGRIVRVEAPASIHHRRGAPPVEALAGKPPRKRRGPAGAERPSGGWSLAGRSGYVLVADSPEVAEAIGVLLPGLTELVAEFGPDAVADQLEQLRRRRPANQSIERLAGHRPVPEAATAEGGPPTEDWRARQEIALARLRETFLEEWTSVSAPELNRITCSMARNGYQRPSEWERQGRIFSVPGARGRLFPLFQIKDNRPRPLVQDVLAILKPTLNGWQIAFWWTTANSWLPGGVRPIDLIDDDPQAVIEAARHEVAEIFP
jgi:hypothetical protein